MNQNPTINLNLIQVVSKYPCLYDTTRRYNRKIKDFAWESVLKDLARRNISIVDPKECWKAIRSAFCRHHKNRNITWTYFDAMMFLEPYLNHRSSLVQVDDMYNNRIPMMPAQYDEMPQSSSGEYRNADVIIPCGVERNEGNWELNAQEIETNGEELLLENINVDNSDSNIDSRIYTDHTYCDQDDVNLLLLEEDEVIETVSKSMEENVGGIDVNISEPVRNPNIEKVNEDEVLLGWDDFCFSDSNGVYEADNAAVRSASDFGKSAQLDYNSGTTFTAAPVVKGSIEKIFQCQVHLVDEVDQDVEHCELEEIHEVEIETSSSGGDFPKRPQAAYNNRPPLIAPNAKKQRMENVDVCQYPVDSTIHQKEHNVRQFEQDDFYGMGGETTSNRDEFRKHSELNNISGSYFTGANVKKRRTEEVPVSQNQAGRTTHQTKKNVEQLEFSGVEAEASSIGADRGKLPRAKDNRPFLTAPNVNRRAIENERISQYQAFRTIHHMEQDQQHADQDNFRTVQNEASCSGSNVQNPSKPSNSNSGSNRIAAPMKGTINKKKVVPKLDKFAKKKIAHNKKSAAALEQEVMKSCKDLRSLNKTAKELMTLQKLELQQRMSANAFQAQYFVPVQQVQGNDALLNTFKGTWDTLTKEEQNEVYCEILTAIEDFE